MDANRKKELLHEYKNRKPEMGIVSFHCVVTGDNYIIASKDTKSDINSNSFQLRMGSNYNRPLQELWNEHGSENFEVSVLEVLPYDKDKPDKDYSEDLSALCEAYLEKDEKIKKLKP